MGILSKIRCWLVIVKSYVRTEVLTALAETHCSKYFRPDWTGNPFFSESLERWEKRLQGKAGTQPSGAKQLVS